MMDRKAQGESNETPEDVATLYSWANLHGAKYRDFSASRAQSRETARQRVQQVVAEERERLRVQTEAAQAAQAAEAARLAEAERQAEIAAQQAAQKAAQQAAQQNAWQQQPAQDRFAAPPGAVPQAAPQYPPQGQQPASYGIPPYQGYRAQEPAPQYPPQESPSQPRAAWPQADPRENFSRPAWLAPTRPELPSQPLPHAPEDTLQGSRDRLTSRWYALKGVFEGTQAAPEVQPAPTTSRAPVLAVFSLAGGVGKTSMVATLGRALSARGERVLLVDTAAYGLLRTFSPPTASGDAPIQMITIDPETLGTENAVPEILNQEVSRYSRGANRVLIDLATASGSTTRRVIRMAPLVVVPIIPDMSSVVSVGSIDSFFLHNSNAAGKQVVPYYVLNQFDYSLPLHLDVREVLREQLGDRLLPFVLRRSPSVSEALAEGMTVMDYAPNSTVAEDFGSLAGWIKSIAAPVSSGYRGVRWSER
jgi:cellulose biosynthesis protein BcsQ